MMPSKNESKSNAKNEQLHLNDELQKVYDLLQQKDYEQSEKRLLTLSKAFPNEMDVNLHLLECYTSSAQISKAQKLHKKLAKKHPNDRALMQASPLIKFYAKDYSGAYIDTLVLTQNERNTEQMTNLILACIACVKLSEYSAVAEQDAIRFIEEGKLTAEEFQQFAAPLVCFKLRFDQENVVIDLLDFSNDALLLKMLTLSRISSPLLDQIMSFAREKLLTLSLAEMQLPDSLVPLAQAIAIQSHHNAYIYPVSEAEEGLLVELEQMLIRLVEAGDWSPEDVEGLFLLLCMYRNLTNLPVKDALLALNKESWPNSLKDIVTLSL